MLEVNFVCKKCFNDKELINWIEENGHIIDCNWCDSTSVKGVPLTSLGDEFRKILPLYGESPGLNGDSIEYLLQEDWNIFSDLITEPYDDRLHNLTVAILKAGIEPKDDVDLSDFSGSFYRQANWLEEDWGTRVDNLFNCPQDSSQEEKTAKLPEPEGYQWPPTMDMLEYVFEGLAKNYTSGKIYYRARIHKNRNRVKRFLPKEMGAPEPEDTNAGRCNEKGQPVLYLASDDKTAISEVRPWKDSSVAVGEAQLLKDINLISLINYIIPESPFFQDNLYWPIWVGGLFHRLAEELSRPVMPNEKEIFYKPTQYLCEHIKKLGYDGIIYPSGLGPGNNIILFDPKIAKITFISYVRINDINFLTDPINENEVLYEETMYDHFLK